MASEQLSQSAKHGLRTSEGMWPLLGVAAAALTIHWENCSGHAIDPC